METIESSHDSDGGAPEAAAPVARTFTLRPTLRSLLVAFFVHHNPFYLLSALCMIAGCYTLNGALALRTGQVRRILILLGTINLYEWMLIGLGLFLIRRRGIIRDGRTLLLLQMVFLVDLTFLSAETASADRRAGLWICLALVAMAFIKVGVVLRTLSPRFPVKLFGVIAAQLAGLYLIPCIFARIDHDGAITQTPFYTAWWIVGLLAAFPELQRWTPGTSQPVPVRVSRLGAGYGAIAFCSVLAHLGMLHWVYRITFIPANLSPLLLGLALLSNRAVPLRLITVNDLVMVRVVLPLLAVLASVIGYDHQSALFFIGRADRLAVTPLLLSIAGASVVYVYLFVLPALPYLLLAVGSAAALALFGPTVQEVSTSAGSMFRLTFDLFLRILPKTAAGWGITAVAGAFAFLGIGAAVSLSQGRGAPSHEPKRDAPT